MPLYISLEKNISFIFLKILENLCCAHQRVYINLIGIKKNSFYLKFFKFIKKLYGSIPLTDNHNLGQLKKMN